MKRGDNMNELLAMEQSPLVIREISEEVFNSWTSFIDASPRTVETYSKAIKQAKIKELSANARRSLYKPLQAACIKILLFLPCL